MRNLLKTRFAAFSSVLVGSVLLSTTASAQSVDVSAAVTELTGVGGAIAAVGGAMLGLAAIAIGFKWAKAAIFG